MADVITFLLEKIAGARPINVIVSRRGPTRSPVFGYLIAAACQSLEKPVPVWTREITDDVWSRRMLRLIAGEAKRRDDFAAAKELSLSAAKDERFAAFSSEYFLSAAACAYELNEFEEACRLVDEAFARWLPSRTARLLEPRLEATANYLKWASLYQLGASREGLPFLYAAAKTQRDRTMRCQQWLQLIREASEVGDERFASLGIKGAIAFCPRHEPELQYWRDTLDS